MADKKISQLSAASTPLAGTEVLPIVQSGSTVKVSAADVTAGRAVSALTYTSTATTGTAPFTVSSTTQVANLNAATAGTASNLLSNATTGVLQVTGPGAGTTRVMTVPNANFTAARTDAAQTFSGNQTFTGTTKVSASEAYLGVEATNPSGKLWYLISGGGGNVTSGYFSIWNGANNNKVISLAPSTTEDLVSDTSGNFEFRTGNVKIGTSGKGIIDTNGNESMLFTATASAVNELTVANAATGSPPAISATGGDTNIGLSLVTKGSGGLRLNSALNRFVRTGTNGDTTVAATISFVSQGTDWISQLVEFQVALSSSAGSSVHGGVVRYILSSLDSGTGLANVTALASDLTGVTAATSVSGNDLTVTFTITGGGNAIRYGISAEVLSSNGAGWVASGMTVA